MKDFELDKRRLVIGGVAIFIVTVYLIRLFTLQLLSDDYKKNADSNAFLKKIEYPSRGAIMDRHGRLLVYNQPAYDIMVVMNEEKGRLDTMEFCNALGITKEYFIKRMNDIKDRNKNPGYSRFTEQVFMSQLSDKEFSVFQEKIFRFPGFYVQKRSIRQYQYPYAAHVLGDVAEVSKSDVENSDYYQPGDYIGKLGIERSYEEQLRGEKGVQILLRDAHGRQLSRRKIRPPTRGRQEPDIEYRHQIARTWRTFARRKDWQHCGNRAVYGRSALHGVVANLRSAHHGGPTKGQKPPRSFAKRVETLAQSCHHGAISAWFYIQNHARTDLHDRGDYRRTHPLSLRTRL